MKDTWIPRIAGRTIIRLTITTFRIRTIVSYNRWQCTTNVTAFPGSIFFGGMLRRCSTISAYMRPTILKEISKVKQVKLNNFTWCVCIYLYLYPGCWFAAMSAVSRGTTRISGCCTVAQFTGTRWFLRSSTWG